MSAIFSFSDDVLLEIFRQWICIRGLVYLDSSLCNHSSRIEFVGLLKHRTLVLFNKTYDWTCRRKLPYIIGFFNWLMYKRVKLLEIKFLECQFVVRSDLTATKLDFSMTTHLHFSGFKTSKLSDLLIIIRSCLNLTSLKLSEIYKISDAFISKIVLMSKITELSVVGNMPFLTKTSVEYVANRCKYLKKLTFTCEHHKTRKFALYCPNIIIDLLKRNPSLVMIELKLYRELETDELTLLSLISTCCCKTITSISLSTIKEITPVDISNCLLDCYNLLFLKLKLGNYDKNCKCYLLYESDVVNYKHIHFYTKKNVVQFELRFIEILTAISDFTLVKLHDKSSLLTDYILSKCIVNQASTLIELILHKSICTNNSLQTILSACHNLTSLELRSCNPLDVNLIEPMYMSNFLSLKINFSYSLRTDAVILFISLSNRLEHLEIVGCDKVDSKAVREFCANNMPQLKLNCQLNCQLNLLVYKTEV